MKGLSRILIFFAVFIVSMNKSLCDSYTSEVEMNNIFIVNYVILKNYTEKKPFYFKPNIIKEISENKIKIMDFKKWDLSLHTFHFDMESRIKYIYEWGLKKRDYTYQRVEDTLFVLINSSKADLKFYYTDGRITSYTERHYQLEGLYYDFDVEINYEKDKFSIDFYNRTYFFDNNRRFISYGRHSGNIFKSFFCGDDVDLYRDLSYNKDTVMNSINELILNKYYNDPLNLPYEFNYIGVNNHLENSYDVYQNGYLSFRFLLNEKGLVSKIFEIYNPEEKAEYSILYTYY